jgi:hypothetical protein
MNEKVYKTKLEFYYRSLVIYLLTLVVYILIKGKFFQERFEVVFKDPIIYVISIFIIYFVIVLITNSVSAKKLVFDEKDLTIRNRFGQRRIGIKDIVGVRFSRPKRKSKEDSSNVRIVKLKLLNRRRQLRIRVNDFENEKELEAEFRNISRKLTSKQWKQPDTI